MGAESTANATFPVPWAAKGEVAAVKGGSGQATSQVTPQSINLRNGGIRRVISNLTPRHAYHVTWKRKFPATNTCNAATKSGAAVLSRIRLHVTVDNLVLFAQVINETRSTEGYGPEGHNKTNSTESYGPGHNATNSTETSKLRAEDAGPEIHFVAGWEKATLAFEASPLEDDGCMVSIDDVRVEDKGSFNGQDLVDNFNNKLVDAAGMDAMVSPAAADRLLCTAADRASLPCADQATALERCSGGRLSPSGSATVVAAGSPETCSPCVQPGGGATRDACPSMPEQVVQADGCTLTLDVSTDWSPAVDPGASAYDVSDAAAAAAKADWSKVEAAFSARKVTGPAGIDVVYTATDKAGKAGKATRKVVLVDATPPRITPKGNYTIKVPLLVEASHAEPYADPGATAVDAVDGDVTSEIKTSLASSVDRTTLGDYTIEYVRSSTLPSPTTTTLFFFVLQWGSKSRRCVLVRLCPVATSSQSQ